MIQKKIKSRPLNLIFLLVPFSVFVCYLDKIFIWSLYEYWDKGNIIVTFITLIFFLFIPHFVLIYGLLYLLLYKIELDNYGIIINTLLNTHIISFREISNIYWQEYYCTIEGDFSYCVLIIEMYNGKQIKLGPEWTNRDILYKYLKSYISK
jgi:hypothetical protein